MGVIMSFSNSLKINFGKKADSEPKDAVIKPTAKNKAVAAVQTAKKLPDYVNRGMQGDPDSNFYEFSQVSKIPYFLGGPGLVATIVN